MYVSVDRLMALHPAWAAFGHLPQRSARDGGETAEDAVGGHWSRPEPMRPLELMGSPSPNGTGSSDAAADERLRRLGNAAERRTAVAMARRARLDYAALVAERAEAYRAAESTVAERQAAIRGAARAEIRDTDLKIVALEAQIGSPAAGPPETVQAALGAARSRKARLERRLSQDLAQVRIDEFREVRERLEQKETALSRARDIEGASRAADTARDVRSYEASLRGAQAEMPPMALPDRPNPPDLGSVPTHPGSARRNAVRGYSSPLTGPEPRSAETLRFALREDIQRQARRVARDRGWSVQFAPAPGLPDRTAEMAHALKAYWGGT